MCPLGSRSDMNIRVLDPCKSQFNRNNPWNIFHSYNRIESAFFDGKGRKIVVQSVPHVFGVSLRGDYIYWTDWTARSVMRAHKRTGKGSVMLKGKLDAQPMDLKVVSAARQNCEYTGWPMKHWFYWGTCFSKNVKILFLTSVFIIINIKIINTIISTEILFL